VSEELIDKARRMLLPVDPDMKEPTLNDQVSPRPGDAMIRLNREMSLQELCDFHAKRLGVPILRVERDS
jgi:hypothetical protein